MAHAATSTIYTRAINLHPPWMAFRDACGTQQVLHFVFVLPFQPFTLFAVSTGCALIGRRPIWLNFIEHQYFSEQ
jgi:hypothetical protein